MRIRKLLNVIFSDDIEKNKYKNIITYSFIFLIPIIVSLKYLLFNFMSNTDEFSSIASIVYLAGRDWSGVSSSSSYHGFGGIMYLLPVVKFFPNVDIYKCILFGSLGLRCCCVLFTYLIAHKTFGVQRVKSIILAVICDIGLLQPDSSARLSGMSEVPITFIALLFIVLLTYSGSEKLYALRCFFAGMVAGFGVIVHSRIIIVYVVSVICFILFVTYNKKIRIFPAILFCIGFLVVFIISLKVNNYVCAGIYSTNEVQATSVEGIVTTRLRHYIAKIFNVYQLKTIIETFCAQISNYTYYTFGVIWLLVGSNINYIVMTIKENQRDMEKVDQYRFLISLFGICTFVFMIISISISSTGAVLGGNYRWYSYLRYSLPYSWIVVLTGIINLKYMTVKERVITYMVPLFLSMKYILSFVVDKLDISRYGMSYNFFNRFFYRQEDTANAYYFRYSLILLVVAVIFILVMKYSNNTYIICVLYVFLSIIVTCQINMYFFKNEVVNADRIDKTTEYIRDSYEYGGEDAYVVGNTKYAYNLQLKCPNYRFILVTDIDGITDNRHTVFSDTSLELSDTYHEIQLDKSEYVYIVKRDSSSIRFNMLNKKERLYDLDC